MTGWSAVLSALLDGLKDGLLSIPILFLAYLLMELLERSSRLNEGLLRRYSRRAGPALGGLLGIVPQCGISGAAATLFSTGSITVGTMLAVFFATSDEMLPIFLAEQVAPMTILKIMGVKLMIGMVMGFVVDAAVRLARRDRERLRIHELCERDRCHCNSDCDACEQQPELAYDYEHDEEHEHHHEGGSILRSALKHTVQVTVFIFVITLVLDGALELVGEDALGAFLGSNPVLSVLGSALVGLIPNCAASVVIAQLYVEGALGAGAMMAGLLVSAGVGLLVLFRTNRGLRQNLIVLAGLWATGVFWGLIISAFGIAF